MRSGHPLLAVHAALSSALSYDMAPQPAERVDYRPLKGGAQIPWSQLPRQQYMRRPQEHEVEVHLFPQTWGSTALGYGGLGGAAMTQAYTVVVSNRSEACVYFGQAQLGYRVDFTCISDEQLAAFKRDLSAHQLLGRREAAKAYGAVDQGATAPDESLADETGQ